MKQYEKIQKDITECNSAMEMIGYLDGINASAIMCCMENHPEEVWESTSGTKISVTGMCHFLEREV